MLVFRAEAAVKVDFQNAEGKFQMDHTETILRRRHGTPEFKFLL